MRSLGLIGAGRIGGAVADAVASGRAGAWRVAGVLTRQRGADFFAGSYDLILETAGPAALAVHGERALGLCDVWTVSGAALADAALEARLRAAGSRHGHRLRLVAGALLGLDGLGALAAAPGFAAEVHVDVPDAPGPRRELFRGSAREAAACFPHGVNVAMAAAVAAGDPDRTTVVVEHPDMARRMGWRADSAVGRMEAWSEPRIVPGSSHHLVASSLVAALRQADAVIWAG